MQPGNRHLWGTDIYTEDSDLVDVLMHAGYIASTGGIATPSSLAAVRVVVQPMVGVKKDEPQLLAAVNKALQEMEASGELDALWTKWYGPQTKYDIKRDKKLTPISAL